MSVGGRECGQKGKRQDAKGDKGEGEGEGEGDHGRLLLVLLDGDGHLFAVDELLRCGALLDAGVVEGNGGGVGLVGLELHARGDVALRGALPNLANLLGGCLDGGVDVGQEALARVLGVSNNLSLGEGGGGGKVDAHLPLGGGARGGVEEVAHGVLALRLEAFCAVERLRQAEEALVGEGGLVLALILLLLVLLLALLLALVDLEILVVWEWIN